MTIAYLGPAGTFSQQAARLLFPDAELKPLPAIEDVFESVTGGEVDGGVVPFENSTEGAVNATLDALLFESAVTIKALLPLRIRHCLMTASPTGDTQDIEQILSHPQSLAQCRKYIRDHFEHAAIKPVSSNGEAARLVAESTSRWAAIGPQTAAARYGLQVCAEDIQDQSHNITSFIHIVNEKSSRPAYGLTTSIAFSTYNNPGELYHMLSIFDVYRVNMTKIISRPMKQTPGEYIFYIDIEDYKVRDAARALTLVRERAHYFRFLGSYPVLAES